MTASENWKLYVGVVAAILLLYGVYGYFIVGKQITHSGKSAFCPFGRGSDLFTGNQPSYMHSAQRTGPCSYSFTSLLIGVLLLLFLTTSYIPRGTSQTAKSD